MPAVLVSNGKVGVKVLPSLLGQSRGAEEPSGGMIELPVILGEADALVEVEVRDALLSAEVVSVALVNTELVDCGMLGMVELDWPSCTPYLA